MNVKIVYHVLLLTFLLSACSMPKDAQPSEDGFALLYSVTSQQQNVDKLLWIKDPGSTTKAWIEQIATFNQQVTQQLEAWRDGGKITSLETRDLPPAEVKSRERAARRTTGELLFSQETNLRITLVVTQLKALGYCADLCYAIGEETSDEAIERTVTEWETRFKELDAVGMSLLETKSITDADPPQAISSPDPARK